MALRDKMARSAMPYLHQGEPIRNVIGAQTASQWIAALGGVFFFLGLNRYRIIVVTPGRILLLDAGVWSMTKARSVVAEWPRATRLGPTSGALWHVIPLGDTKLRVHRRFFKDIEAADAAGYGQQQHFQQRPDAGPPQSHGQPPQGQYGQHPQQYGPPSPASQHEVY